MARRRTIEQARRLRRTMSAPEVRLWSALRMRPQGTRFRRQHPLGPFILDFYCAQARLAIEIDGMAHDMGDRPERDQVRDRRLAEQGIVTLRFPAFQVMADLDGVVAHILQHCAPPLHHPADGPPPHATHGEDG
ncbi:endonuclease domain-containing protein [Sphingomonas sp. EC-HK361]|uniref:endonuclease domain-containing protein n=1 Tax=Sphingomonas sp. EC-HK361 TaxID=2038397 RepID=UPI00125F52D2|nr:endonuclease domain-containing protein [Sphingomonas sp. EC-HK361]